MTLWRVYMTNMITVFEPKKKKIKYLHHLLKHLKIEKNVHDEKN